MPAAAVARRTPAIAGMSGKRAGASGETAVAMGELVQKRSGPGHGRAKRCRASNAWWPTLMKAIERAKSIALILRRLFRRLSRRRRLRLCRRLRRLVEPLDLGLGAQLVDELDLRLALDIGLELRLHLVELGRLALALVLDL